MDSTTKAIIEATAEATARRVMAAHVCPFTEAEVGHVKALGEAITEEGANHQTLRIVVQIGRSVQDVTGTVRKWAIIVLLMGALFVGMKLWGVKALTELWK